jgi:hypothetical protein
VLTDAQWEVLSPLIEACRPKGKTPLQHLRRTVEAIICTSAPAPRGDTSVIFQISGVTAPREVARIAEQKFRDLLRQYESEQHALLSD